MLPPSSIGSISKTLISYMPSTWKLWAISIWLSNIISRVAHTGLKFPECSQYLASQNVYSNLSNHRKIPLSINGGPSTSKARVSSKKHSKCIDKVMTSEAASESSAVLVTSTLPPRFHFPRTIHKLALLWRGTLKGRATCLMRFCTTRSLADSLMPFVLPRKITLISRS